MSHYWFNFAVDCLMSIFNAPVGRDLHYKVSFNEFSETRGLVRVRLMWKCTSLSHSGVKETLTFWENSRKYRVVSFLKHGSNRLLDISYTGVSYPSQLGQLSLLSFRVRQMSSKLQSDVRCGGAIWWMFTGWRPGVVDWGGGVYAGLRRVQLFVSTCNGLPRLALQHH